MILITMEEINMICQNCGNPVIDGATFCPVCGSQQVHANYNNQQKNESKSLLIVITILLVAVIAAIIVTATVMILKSNRTTETVSSPEPTVIPTQTEETPVVTDKPAPPPTPPTQAPVIENTTVVKTMFVVNCNEWISLRSTPSTSASVIAYIPYGASVGYIEPASNGFYKINYNGKIGYALYQYLSDYQPARKTAPVTQQPNTYYRVVNCREWISLRSTPSTSAPKLAEIPLGATVQFISTASNGFYKVSYNGLIGYALASYLG